MTERPRQMVVQTAQIWYDAARKPTKHCSVEMGLVNALNHTENALIAILDGNEKAAEELRERLRVLRLTR